MSEQDDTEWRRYVWPESTRLRTDILSFQWGTQILGLYRCGEIGPRGSRLSIESLLDYFSGFAISLISVLPSSLSLSLSLPEIFILSFSLCTHSQPNCGFHFCSCDCYKSANVMLFKHPTNGSFLYRLARSWQLLSFKKKKKKNIYNNLIFSSFHDLC